MALTGFIETAMKADLIAPCGMNCALCISYQAMINDLKAKGFTKRYCTGCIPRGKNCEFMKQNCDLLGMGVVRFCYECDLFPCTRLKKLDKRYTTQYHMSMINNLVEIQMYGIEEFLQTQDEKWQCPTCGGTICCHNGLCLTCQLDTLKANKKYRWGE